MSKKKWHLGLRITLVGIVVMGCVILGRTAVTIVRRWYPPTVSEAIMRPNLLTPQEVEAWQPGVFRPADKSTDELTKYQIEGRSVQVGAMYVLVHTLDTPKESDRLASKFLYHDVGFVADEQVGISEFEYRSRYAFLLDQIPNNSIPEIASNADQSAMGCFHTSFVKSCKVVLRYKDHVETLELFLPASFAFDAESIIDLVKIIDARPLNQRR